MTSVQYVNKDGDYNNNNKCINVGFQTSSEINQQVDFLLMNVMLDFMFNVVL